MVGRKSIDTQGPNPGTRCRPDARLARVTVFPHGKCDVRGQFFQLVSAFDVPGTFPGFARSRLEPYRYPRLCSPGQETEAKIVSTNPWALRPEQCEMPRGYYNQARGTTDVWVECWRWAVSSPWDALAGFLSETP